MKKRNKLFFVGLIIMLCAILTTCENPILKKWWVGEEEDFDYVAIIKDVPILIYETIVEDHYIYQTIYNKIIQYVPEYITEYVYQEVPGETIYIQVPGKAEPIEVPGPPVYIEKPMPPEILMQYIEILSIEFIIFSGNQTNYNWPSTNTSGTSLTIQEQSTNNKIVQELVAELRNNVDYFLILHGHSNPIDFSQSELEELMEISTKRAVAVQNAIVLDYDGETLPVPSTPPPSQYIPPMIAGHDLIGRISTKGYGGGRNVAGPSSSYSGLNRRVEAILFRIVEEPATMVGTER